MRWYEEYEDEGYGGEDDKGELYSGDDPRLETEELEDVERAMAGGRPSFFDSDTRRNSRS